jgi:putative endonuclease
MSRDRYYVYIVANISKTLYTGVTNDLTRRIFEHKRKLLPSFTSRYNINELVYFEETSNIHSALAPRKGDQRMAPIEENSIDRIDQS